MSDLDEIIERLNWARSEIIKLRVDLQSWYDNSIVLSSQADVENPHLIQLLAHYTTPIPLSCRARSGTIVNELRSLLDGLASSLAVRNKKTPNGVYFPISANESDFDSDARLRAKIRKLSDVDQLAIMATRPFAEARDGSPGNVLIYGLHQADIRRKHHKLVANNIGSSVGVVHGEIGLMFSAPKPLAGSPEVMAWISSDSVAEISFSPTFEYSEPDVLRGLEVTETLDKFADEVSSIIEVFQ